MTSNISPFHRAVFRSALALMACLLCAGIAAASGASAPSVLPAGQQLKYHCQWTPRVKQGVPWTGDMTIRVNDEGIINGTYRSTSIRPDPFYGKIVTVTGGLTGGNNIRLSFGISPSVSVQGQVVSNGIQGTTSYKGATLEFLAALAH